MTQARLGATLARLLADGLIALVGFFVACVLVVNPPISWWMTTDAGRGILGLAALYSGMMVLVLAAGRLPQRPWNNVSARDVGSIIRLTIAGALLFLTLVFLISRAELLPRSVLLIAWFLTAGCMAAGRLCARAMAEGWLMDVLVPFRMARSDKAKAPIILVGPLARLERAVLDIRDSGAPYRVVGVVVDGDAPGKVSGVRVIGATDDLESLVDSFLHRGQRGPSLVFVDPPTSMRGVDETVLAKLRRKDAPIMRLPKVTEMTEWDRQSLRLRKVRLEELLSRPTVQLRDQASVEGVRGKCVMVTGAGGSIGSELCRQLAALGCGRLILLDIAETPLFEIDREIASNYPSLSRRAVLASVRDEAVIAKILREEKPDRLFHAAALKHVSLMETHPSAAVLTNVSGTATVAMAAIAAGVRHMVMVSTDKAVNPSSVMGATKRLAETLVRSLNQEGGRTQFSVVRFGNVLNSNGSVVPIFRNQIETGGPVTVTHPEVERYFMTIPEAVELVLHAAHVAEERPAHQSGVFVLEMGEPVKIADMAKRMIDLLGRPDTDPIEIKLIGLQPGEKLSEQLVDTEEAEVFTTDGVMEVKAREFVTMSVQDAEALCRFCHGQDNEAVRRRLFEEVARVRGQKVEDATPRLHVVHDEGERRIS